MLRGLLLVVLLSLCGVARADDWKARTHAVEGALRAKDRAATLAALEGLLAEDSKRAVDGVLAAVPQAVDYLGLVAYHRLVDRLAALQSEPARRAIAHGLTSTHPLAVRWLAGEVQVRTQGREALVALLAEHDERLALLGVELAEATPGDWVDDVLRARREELGARTMKALARWIDAALARRQAPPPPAAEPATAEAEGDGQTRAREPASPRTVAAAARALAAVRTRIRPGDLVLVHDINRARWTDRLSGRPTSSVIDGEAGLPYVERYNRRVPTAAEPLDPRSLVLLDGLTSGDEGFGQEQVTRWRAALTRFVHDGGHVVDHGWFDHGPSFDHTTRTEEGHLRVFAKPRFPVQALFPGATEAVTFMGEAHVRLGAPLDPLLDGSPLHHPFMEAGLRWGRPDIGFFGLVVRPDAHVASLVELTETGEHHAVVAVARVGKGAVLRIHPDKWTNAEVDAQAWLLALNFMTEWLDRREGREPRR